jgi:hypothetical protein
MRALPLLVSVAATGAGLLSFAAEAKASIKNPNDHPSYKAELEPHLNAILWRRDYGYGRSYRYSGVGDPEFGAGFRATIELGDPAFIPKLNNTVGISFGIDLTNCVFCRYDYSIWTPVTLQWNFFLHKKWSVFADIGGVIRSDGFYDDIYVDPFFMAGGRFHFTDKVSLTMRVGYPFVSVGVSFFVG